ncbi:MAG: FGGY-family carbohydrate kinase [Haliscomenobacter sp.]
MKVTLVFDIGKTNKKLFLFDQDFQQVHKEYIRFDEIADEDGFPADDLDAITDWIRQRFAYFLKDKSIVLDAVNFSTYGASFVHLDRYGKPLTPLYNYTKPLPEEVLRPFYARYGSEQAFARATASPASGMLNSGFQLYWLKQTKPDVYERIRYSLHFPQYLSYLFTGIPISEFTSIGCHTSLWDYAKNDYHDWVFSESMDRNLPPVSSTGISINMMYNGKPVRIGTGIHDSSAALLPYLRADHQPFLLISTGTWSISLNPFSEDPITEADLQDDCLNYMRIDGKPVRASRLFLGSEYQTQVEALCRHFGKEYGYHRSIQFDEQLYQQQVHSHERRFRFEHLHSASPLPATTDLSRFSSFESAFHGLMIELMDEQLLSARRAIGNTPVEKIYIDGGFADNDVYVKLASHHFSQYKLRTTQSPLGSALGAALVMSDKQIKAEFLKKHYAMKKHKPLILG